MDDVVAMRALFERVGFSNPTSAQVVSTQGIVSLEELWLLNDKEVESLCKLVCSSGRGISNTNAAGAGQLARISTPGHAVSMIAVKNYKLATYAIRHCERTMRHVAPGKFTLDQIHEVRILRGQDKSFKDPDPSESPKIQATNCPKTLEAIDLWIYKHRCTVKPPWIMLRGSTF